MPRPVGGLPPRKPMTPDQQDLAKSYIGLARNLITEYWKKFPAYQHQEIESAVMLALTQAAQSFDPSRNVKFSTFVRDRVRGAVLDCQRDLKFAGFKPGIGGYRTGKAGEPPKVHGFLPHGDSYSMEILRRRHRLTIDDLSPEPPDDSPSGFGSVDTRDEVEFLISRLPTTLMRQVIRLLYVDGMNQTQAGEALGLSQNWVSMIHVEAISEMKLFVSQRKAV